jgi:dethiobiotin synthetase
MRGVFLTGTDTGCGKTHVATALIEALRRRGFQVAGFKPVAAGATICDGELQNDDALALWRAGNAGLAYGQVNPYCLAEPVSPHLAAATAGVHISPHSIAARLHDIGLRSDLVIVEGAGGWFVPLGPNLDIAGLARHLDLPVVLVVGLRLGCLNHAQLSERAILASGASLLGWIASQVDPRMARLGENLDTLRARLDSPCLGVLPHRAAADDGDHAVPFDLDAIVDAGPINDQT